MVSTCQAAAFFMRFMTACPRSSSEQPSVMMNPACSSSISRSSSNRLWAMEVFRLLEPKVFRI